MNASGRSSVVRVHDFFRMNPPDFLGSQTNEDPQSFMDVINKLFELMHVTRNDRVELALY